MAVVGEEAEEGEEAWGGSEGFGRKAARETLGVPYIENEKDAI